MRLIDADALPYKEHRWRNPGGEEMSWSVVDKKDIDNAPTVDAVPLYLYEAVQAEADAMGDEVSSTSLEAVIKLQQDTIDKQKGIIKELDTQIEVLMQAIKTDDVLFKELGSNENRSD